MFKPIANRQDGLAEPTARPIDSRIRLVLMAFLVGAAYYLGALIGFTLTFPTDAVSTLWPPNAILLAALLLTASRTWWVVLLGAFPAHLIVQSQSGVPTPMILGWFVSNSSEALIGAFCVRRFIKGPLDFASPKGISVYVTFVVIIAPFLSSFLDAAFVALVAWKEDNYWEVWRMRLPSNVLAALTIPPLILLWGVNGVARLLGASLRRYAEGFLLASGLLAVSFFAFNWQTAGPGTTPALVYLPLPFLLWAAIRFGPAGASTSLLFIVLGSIYGAAQGRGPFINSSPAENVLSLQIFLIAISLPIMFLAALVAERRAKTKVLSESEARFRTMADTAPVMIWMADADKLCNFVSKGWLDFTGRKMEQELGSGWSDRIHREDLKHVLEIYANSFDRRREFTTECRMRRYDEYRWVLHKGIPRFDADGTFLGYIGSAIDITERKQAEQALQDLVAGTAVTGKEFFPAFVSHVAAALDVHCVIVTEVANDQKSRLKILANWVGKDWAENSEFDVANTPCEQALRDGKMFFCRERVRELFPYDRHLADLNAASYVGIPLFSSSGRLIGNLCIIDNKPLNDEQRARSVMEIFAARAAAEIERKRAEEALRDTQERLARTEKFSLVMVTHTDLEGRWLKVPPTLCDLLGYTEEELLERRFYEVTHPDDIETNATQRVRLMRSEIKSFDLEKRYIRKDGGIVWVYLNVSVVTDTEGTPVHFLSYMRDITDRKRAEGALRESEMRHRAILESALDCIITIDHQGRIIEFNPAAEKTFGYKRADAIGKRMADLIIPPTLRDRHYRGIAHYLATGEGPVIDKRLEMVAMRADGNEFPIELTVTRIGLDGPPMFTGYIRDITERKRAEEEVRQLKERLEAENVYLRTEVSETHRFGELTGQSPAIRKVVGHVEQVAGTDMTVLISGETGTGKELVARAVHARSTRKDRPLVKVNCSALPAELIESELFGHEKGAFTGATARQVGRFELADE
ncbi:MAG TPA: PAS domain S-box protein, partial [Candidatus Binatia bacterium]